MEGNVMEGWQERVMKEREELEDKIFKLTRFTKTPAQWNVLHQAERGRLRTQLHLMRQYANVLTDRIEAWKEAGKDGTSCC
jgi:hypothetical protein